MSVARVRKQAEEADQMIQSLRDGDKPSEDTSTETALDPVQDQGVVSEQGEPGVTEQAPGVTSDDTDWPNEARLWEQRYRSLNGMIQSRDKQIQQLHELLANMQQAQSKPQETQPQHTQPASLITKEDEDSYGADLVDMARRAGRQESAQLIAELRAEMSELRNSLQGVSQVTQMSAKDRFESKLDSLTSNQWKQIDTDPLFIDWLKASNARMKVFSQGVQDQDAATVAEFFNEYVKLASANRAAAEQPKQTRKAELERQVAPGKSKAGVTQVSQAGDKKIWAKSEIAHLYSNAKQYPADEFNRLEKEIFAAQREGRVDPNR